MQNKKKLYVITISIISNLILTILKLIIGYLTGLVSVIAEGLHSLNDLIASVIAFIGVKLSLKPADKDHQYGHGKIEVLTGSIENFLILLISIFIFYEGINKFFHPVKIKHIDLALFIMIFSGIVNFFVSKYLLKRGKELKSIGIEVDGEHLRADVITSFGVSLSIIIIKITNKWWVDPVTAIIIGIWIFFIFIRLLKKLMDQIVDRGIKEDDIEKIKKILKSFTDIKDFHKLRTRQSGPTIFIDVHIKVDKNLSVEKSHNITKDVENKIKDEFKDVNVLIHIEPFYE